MGTNAHLDCKGIWGQQTVGIRQGLCHKTDLTGFLAHLVTGFAALSRLCTVSKLQVSCSPALCKQDGGHREVLLKGFRQKTRRKRMVTHAV